MGAKAVAWMSGKIKECSRHGIQDLTIRLPLRWVGSHTCIGNKQGRKEINYSRQRSICARGLILSVMFLNLGVYSSKSVLKIFSYIQSLILNSRVLFLMEDFSAKSQYITLHPVFQNKGFPLELSLEEWEFKLPLKCQRFVMLLLQVVSLPTLLIQLACWVCADAPWYSSPLRNSKKKQILSKSSLQESSESVPWKINSLFDSSLIQLTCSCHRHLLCQLIFWSFCGEHRFRNLKNGRGQGSLKLEISLRTEQMFDLNLQQGTVVDKEVGEDQENPDSNATSAIHPAQHIHRAGLCA